MSKSKSSFATSWRLITEKSISHLFSPITRHLNAVSANAAVVQRVSVRDTSSPMEEVAKRFS